MAPSAQKQIRDQYASLTRTIGNRTRPSTELSNAYGEMGKLLMAAQYSDPAEACLLNAQSLDPSDFRWPYYLAHLYRTRGRRRRNRGRSSSARFSSIPTMCRRSSGSATPICRSGTARRRRRRNSRRRCRSSRPFAVGAIRARARGAGEERYRARRHVPRRGAENGSRGGRRALSAVAGLHRARRHEQGRASTCGSGRITTSFRPIR